MLSRTFDPNYLQMLQSQEDWKGIEAENQKQFDRSQAPLKAALAAALAYGTGGLTSMIPTAMGGQGLAAGMEAGQAFAPTLANVLSAGKAGLDVLGKPDATWEQTAGYGLQKGIEPEVTRYAAQRTQELFNKAVQSMGGDSSKLQKSITYDEKGPKYEVKTANPLQLTPEQQISLMAMAKDVMSGKISRDQALASLGIAPSAGTSQAPTKSFAAAPSPSFDVTPKTGLGMQQVGYNTPAPQLAAPAGISNAIPADILKQLKSNPAKQKEGQTFLDSVTGISYIFTNGNWKVK